MEPSLPATRRSEWAIWAFAFGYFACYVPYSALTKALSRGALSGMSRPVPGFELLPTTATGSLLSMALFISVAGWWHYAGTRTVLGLRLPWPGRWTFLSGLCTSAIIATTTLAYTVSGTSIVFMMLLMRGGVLVLAPLVDLLVRRRVSALSWVALALSLAAVVVATGLGGDWRLSGVALLDAGIYLLGYFVRLRCMSRLAKAPNRATTLRYFVEEQMVATPALVLALVLAALVGEGPVLSDIRRGFTEVLARGQLSTELAVGILSQGTGLFGLLILLDPRENTFCVPVNRASSLLAGVVASALLSAWLGMKGASSQELLGAGLVAAALLVLGLPALRSKPAAPPQPAVPATPVHKAS
jgi:hypothetical protein